MHEPGPAPAHRARPRSSTLGQTTARSGPPRRHPLTAVRADRAAPRRYSPATPARGRAALAPRAESEVEAAIARALAGAAIGRLVDIGTGTGRMIELFAPGADRALGIDRSPEMLRLARAKLAEAGLDTAELRQGDMYALPLPSGAADTVIIHQVLHYAQNPAAAVAEAGRLLAPGGRLLIVDFAPHEREELRAERAMSAWASPTRRCCAHGGGRARGQRRRQTRRELTVTIWLGVRPEQRLKVVA